MNLRSRTLALSLAGLSLCALAWAVFPAATSVPYRPEWRTVNVAGAVMTFQQKDTTASRSILDLKNSAGTTVANIAIEGSIVGRPVEGAQAVQILTGNTQALVMTAGKSFYPVISDSGARTGMYVPTASVATGTVITIEGTDATKTCRFDDGANNMKLSGNITLGANDTLTVLYNGTNFVELTHSTNGA